MTELGLADCHVQGDPQGSGAFVGVDGSTTRFQRTLIAGDILAVTATSARVEGTLLAIAAAATAPWPWPTPGWTWARA